MPKLKEDKKMSRCKNIICCKWYNYKPVLFLETNFDDMSEVSNVMRKPKGSATKTPASCPNINKLYNNDMSGVDIIDKKQLLTDSIVKASIVFT